MSGMASPPDVDLTSTGNGYPYYSSPREPASLPDAIEQIRAERDILRRRVEERAHDCANVEAELETSRVANAHLIGLNVTLIEERDRLRRELDEIKRVLIGYPGFAAFFSAGGGGALKRWYMYLALVMLTTGCASPASRVLTSVNAYHWHHARYGEACQTASEACQTASEACQTRASVLARWHTALTEANGALQRGGKLPLQLDALAKVEKETRSWQR